MTDLICRKTMRRCDTSGMCSPHGGCQPERSEWQAGYDEGRRMGTKHMYAEVDRLMKENEALRKGWYLNECGDNKFWPEEMEELKAESEALRKAITDIDDALYREYWSEYAGLENTRAILDAAMRKDGQS